MMNSQDITINHLRVNASKNEVKQVTFALQNQSILEQYDHRQWVFVRQLTVNGNKHELNQKTNRLLKQKLQQGVHGANPAAIGADVVYFNNLPELLVFLLQDCSNNTLLTQWYWSAWYRLNPLPKAERVYTVLSEYIEYLPSVIDRLLRQSVIPLVWQQLTHQSANQLLLLMQQQQPLGFRNDEQASINVNHQVDAAESVIRRPLIPSGLMQKIRKPLSVWQKSLNGLSKTDGRVKLVAELIVRIYMPVLSREQYCMLNALLSDVLIQESTVNVSNDLANKNQLPYHAPNKNNDKNIHYLNTTVKENSKNHLESPSNKVTQVMDASEISVIDHTNDRQAIEKNMKKHSKKPVNKVLPENAGLSHDSIIETDDGSVFEQVGEPSFHTQWGGFFYLINLLNTPKCQQWLKSDEVTPSAWLWLFDCSRRLSCSLDKSLQCFIAEHARLDSVDALIEWPSIPVIDNIYNLLSKYEKLIQDPPQWLGIKAKVFANKSHVDCYFSLDDVQLDVRMMGLDVNPGWVPWLGRIVTFYYE